MLVMIPLTPMRKATFQQASLPLSTMCRVRKLGFRRTYRRDPTIAFRMWGIGMGSWCKSWHESAGIIGGRFPMNQSGFCSTFPRLKEQGLPTDFVRWFWCAECFDQSRKAPKSQASWMVLVQCDGLYFRSRCNPDIHSSPNL